MKKSDILKETIYEVLKRDIPSEEEICRMTTNEKIELEKQQQQIIDLFREKITQQLFSYQNKMNNMMNEIDYISSLKQNFALSPDFGNNDKYSDPQFNEKIAEIKTELKKLHQLSKYKRRKAWR